MFSSLLKFFNCFKEESVVEQIVYLTQADTPLLYFFSLFSRVVTPALLNTSYTRQQAIFVGGVEKILG